MEEDDPAHAVGDGGIGGEEDVTEAATVLLDVLHVDVLETLSHGSLTEEGMKFKFPCTLSGRSSPDNHRGLEAHLLIHPQPGFPFLEQQSSEQCQRAPSSALDSGMGTGESS